VTEDDPESKVKYPKMDQLFLLGPFPGVLWQWIELNSGPEDVSKSSYEEYVKGYRLHMDDGTLLAFPGMGEGSA